MRSWCVLLVVFCAIQFEAQAAAADVGADVRVQLLVDHILSTQREDGLFRYDFDYLMGAPKGQDQITRQAGTLFALAEYARDSGDPRIAPAVRAGIAELARKSLPDAGSICSTSWAFPSRRRRS